MPAERVPMRDVRKIIRLKFSARVATREIARRLGMAPSTVRETLKRLAGAGLSWPLPEGFSDTCGSACGADDAIDSAPPLKALLTEAIAAGRSFAATVLFER